MSFSVSVVIPTYNRAALLLEALASVRAQTVPVHEVLVVDDGSTDGTADVVANQPGARYLHQPNAGAAAARNRGIAHASGDFIALLDSDDLWVPDRLARQRGLLERFPETDFVFGVESKFGDDDGAADDSARDPEVRRRLRSAVRPLDDAFGLLVRENPIPTSTVLMRRSRVVAAGPMDTRFVPAEDYDFWLRLAAGGAVFAFEPAPLCRRRLHEGNLVNQWVRMATAVIAVLEHHASDSVAHRPYVERRLAGLRYDLGSRLLKEGRPAEALAYLRQGRPGNVKARLGRWVKLWNARRAVARGGR